MEFKFNVKPPKQAVKARQQPMKVCAYLENILKCTQRGREGRPRQSSENGRTKKLFLNPDTYSRRNYIVGTVCPDLQHSEDDEDNDQTEMPKPVPPKTNLNTFLK